MNAGSQKDFDYDQNYIGVGAKTEETKIENKPKLYKKEELQYDGLASLPCRAILARNEATENMHFAGTSIESPPATDVLRKGPRMMCGSISPSIN